ncbi:MAG: hypothetical protein HP496_08305 [Nitrospira sp.]|nr:hypothetical protein [Nitrospira sp.]
MNFVWPALMVVSALVASASPGVAGYDSAMVCALLTPQELAAAGIAITAQGLMPDESLFLKKGELPGLITDVQIDECTSEMAVEYPAFPIRWSVGTSKDPMDRKAWDKMVEALGQGTRESAEHVEQRFTIEGVDCETFSWSDKTGKQTYAMSCTGHKGIRHVTLEVAHLDRTKLLPVKAVKQLLDKMFARL